MKKTLLATTVAISMLGANGVWAQSTPAMPVEIVSQDASDERIDGSHMLVPGLMMLILIMMASGGSGYVPS